MNGGIWVIKRLRLTSARSAKLVLSGVDLELLKDCWCGSLGNLLDIILYGSEVLGQAAFHDIAGLQL